jgi:hypothetical protein
MNKEQYIRSKFRDILSETLEERVRNIEKDLDQEVPFHGAPGPFDYVQEGKETCNECGGMMDEGECKECGGKGDMEVMENNRKLEKISNKDIEDLLGDISMDLKKGRRKPDMEIDEEESESSYEMKEKLYGKQNKLDKNKNGKLDKEDFEMLHQNEEEQLYEVEFEKEMEEGETEEGNAFTGMLKKTKKGDSFKVGGKKYIDRSSIDEKTERKGKVAESILFTESDLIDLIEKLVIEEKSKFKSSEPKGYKEYEKVHKADKKENNDYLKSVAKKMTDYLKNASDKGSKYEMKETTKFPTENGGLTAKRKKYTPSKAVDDYIDAFSYPGQTNLRFDEIKPNKKNIEKYLKGDSTTGNAQVDKDGNALGNVVPSEVGEKFYKNFEENLYGQEQADASYKRQSQPVDVAGDDTEGGSLNSKRPKGGKTAQSVLNKLSESIDEKKKEILNEEFEKIQKLMGYSKKTQ